MKKEHLISLPFVLLLFSIFIFSCGKKEGKPDNATTLTAVYVLDHATATPDTFSKTFVTYDNTGRATNVANKYYFRGRLEEEENIRYEYTGTDIYASRVLRHTIVYGTTTDHNSDTTIFQRGAGLLYDSTYGIREGIRFYEARKYSGGTNPLVVLTSRWDGVSNTRIDSIPFRYYQTIVNGNLVKQVDTLVTRDPSDTLQYERTEVTREYISRPNPLYAIYVPYGYPFMTQDITIATRYATPRTLLASAAMEVRGWGAVMFTITASISYNYTLKSNGLVDTITETFTENANVRKRTYILVYE